MVAKHINSEFRIAKRDAQMTAANCMPAGFDARALQDQPDSKHVIVERSKKQIRGKSAYMFFRDDRMKSFSSSGQKVNPASKEFWEELKQQFNALTPEMRAWYESLAQESLQDAAAKRRRFKSRREWGFPSSFGWFC